MTHREKKEQHEREIRWLTRVGTYPILAFMWAGLVGMLTGAGGWFWRMILDHLVESLFASLFLVFAYAVLVDWFKVFTWRK